MLPILWQRVVLTLAIVAAGLLFFHAAGDGSGVAIWSLLADGPTVTALVRYGVATIAAILIAGVASALTNPMGGTFVLGAGLCFAAVRGGSIDPWLRGIESTWAYWTLAAEALLWLIWIAVLALATWWIGERLRTLMPAKNQPARPIDHSTGSLRLPLRFHSAGALGTSVVIGMLLTPLLQVNALPGQAIAVLVIVFVIASMTGYFLFPAAHPLALLASPIVTGGLWHTFIALSGISRHTILQQYFQTPIQFYHVGLIAPIYFASAGVAGAALGVTWSAALISDEGDEAEDEVKLTAA